METVVAQVVTLTVCASPSAGHFAGSGKMPSPPATERAHTGRGCESIRFEGRAGAPGGIVHAQITMPSISSTVTVSAVRSQSLVVFGDACAAFCCACSRVSPFRQVRSRLIARPFSRRPASPCSGGAPRHRGPRRLDP